MHLPTLTGLIDRRILINYRCDPAALAAFLPHPFRPKVINGWGMTGICLIRLKAVRPKGLPAFLGITSENGAHRIAVEWEEGGQLQSGVYIPRRDTNSRLNALAGGRVFPGIHHLTRFNVTEKAGNYAISFAGDDGTSLAIHAAKTTQWPDGSVFHNLESASCFFEKGSLGYSPNIENGHFDGLELYTEKWKVSPLLVQKVHSSFFEDQNIFPEGAIHFDNALLMENIPHEWRSKGGKLRS